MGTGIPLKVDFPVHLFLSISFPFPLGNNIKLMLWWLHSVPITYFCIGKSGSESLSDLNSCPWIISRMTTFHCGHNNPIHFAFLADEHEGHMPFSRLAILNAIQKRDIRAEGGEEFRFLAWEFTRMPAGGFS